MPSHNQRDQRFWLSRAEVATPVSIGAFQCVAVTVIVSTWVGFFVGHAVMPQLGAFLFMAIAVMMTARIFQYLYCRMTSPVAWNVRPTQAQVIEMRQRCVDAQLFITVVVPARNEERVIERLVRSVDAVVYPHELLELIIVDDHSDDATPDVIARLQKQFTFLKSVRRQTTGGGKGGCMNAAYTSINKSTSIVGYIDADTELLPHALVSVATMFLDRARMGAAQVPRANYPSLCTNMLERFQFWELMIDYGAQQTRACVNGIVELRGNGEFVRLPVLQQLGGERAWNVDSLTDDLDASLRLHRLGYDIGLMSSIGLMDEPVASWTELWHQRRRWVTGGYQRYLDYYHALFCTAWTPRSKQLDLCFNFLVQYLWATFLIPDYVFATMTGRRPLTAYMGINTFLQAFGFVWCAYAGGIALCRERKGGEWASQSWISILLSPLYLTHLAVAVVFVTPHTMLFPRQLSYAKASHGGSGDTDSNTDDSKCSDSDSSSDSKKGKKEQDKESSLLSVQSVSGMAFAIAVLTFVAVFFFQSASYASSWL